MNRLLRSIIFLVISYSGIYTYGQVESLFYLDESFEDPETRSDWISFPVDPQIKWTYMNGGYNSSPVLAFDGDTNAILQRSDFTKFTRTLISPPVNLEDAVKPLLSFAHAQYPSIFGQDEMRLLFRAGTTGSWDTITEITEAVEKWDTLFFNIQEYGNKYLTENFYVGFCGTTNSGNGVCIDKVVIEEKGIIPKFIRNFSVENVGHGLIPSGVRDVPVIKVYLEVFGNVDSMMLNSITFRSVSDDNTVFEENGFGLFATTSEVFKTLEKGQTTRIGSDVSIIAGDATFNGINYWLKTGRNYIWLTADVKPDRYTHGHIIDFKLMQNSISINDTLLPASEINPSGDNTIEESVFFDDFETDKGWALDYDFQVDTPQGFIINYTRDPDYAYSGQKVLGTDLTENGAYRMNIASGNEYYAVTPLMNLKYFINPRLHMKTWNGFDGLDNATIDVSTDNGSTWNSIWVNSVDGLQAESSWNDLLFTDEFDTLVTRKDSVLVRFAVNFSDNQFALSGWNIENFAVTGNHLDTDVGLTQIISPYSDCIGWKNDTVKIIVKNYADAPSPALIPVFFSLYGADSIRVYDTIPGPIAQNDSIVFTFTETANFPAAGNYDKFMISIDLPGDEDPDNNSLLKPIYIQKTIVPPYTENFESKGGFWIASENSTWECLRPDGSIPVIQESPTSWIQSPYGPYPSDDTSYVTSSCYDLTDVAGQIIELKYWMEVEQGKDGMNVQYTTDDGETWHIIDTTGYGAGWGWFTEHVEILDTVGWTKNTVGWQTVREFLPVTLTDPKVKFRVYWSSDDANNARGAAIDDFKIYSAPDDIGMLSINMPIDACLNENPGQVSVTVKNFGVNTISSGDSVFMGYQFDGNPSVYDTLLLSEDLDPDGTVQFTFSEEIVIPDAGLYNLSIFTLFESDPWFYGSNNDTLSKSLQVYPLPVTGIPDTIQSREPDTVIIRANIDPDYEYSWKDTLGSELSTGDTLKVPGDGVYYLLVTDVGGNGCSILDSTYVELLYNDIGIDTILSPVSSCELTGSEEITVSVKNFGTDSIVAGSKIALSYIYEGNPAVYDTLLLTGAFHSGETIPFTFTGSSEDFTTEGSHNLRLFSYYGGDTIRYNDTLNLNVEVFGYPTVDIGGDKVVEALTYPLDAGAGFSSYLWEDGDTVQVHIADTTGSYYVMVLDIHGCPAYDTAFIRLKIRDVSPSMLINPTSACEVLGNVNVAMQVRNSGTDTVPQNSKIYVKYKLGTQSIISDSLTLSSALYPGSTVNHTFGTTENMNTYGEYDFMLLANTTNDLNPANDTLYDTIFLQPNPVVDFGLEDVHTHRGLDFVLDAGYGEYYEYLWQDGATEQTYAVTSSGLYSVLVTDSRTGCFAGDTVTIYLIITDVGITGVSLGADTCSGSYSDIPVSIKNLGTYTITAGDTINVAYSLNDILIGSDEFILSSAFAFGTTINRNLSGPITLTDGTVATLRFYTMLDEDLRPENDTFTISYDLVKRSPVIDFHDVSGVIITEFPYVLVPEAGHPSYLWQDNSTASTYTVTTAGEYSVTVTASNGCQTSKTVNVVTETGIDGAEGDPFMLKIYPNPAMDFVNLEMDVRETDDVIIEFYNSEGRLIFNDRAFRGDLYYRSIDITSHPKGVYYIRTYNSAISKVIKVVIY